jgi:hypothetical protein
MSKPSIAHHETAPDLRNAGQGLPRSVALNAQTGHGVTK